MRKWKHKEKGFIMYSPDGKWLNGDTSLYEEIITKKQLKTWEEISDDYYDNYTEIYPTFIDYLNKNFNIPTLKK